MEAGHARGRGVEATVPRGSRPSNCRAPLTPATVGFPRPAQRFSRTRGSVFGPDGTVESATCFGNVGHSVGLAEKDATGNHSSAIDGPAGCVDDGDIRARSSELLCDVPTGQTSPEANIGDDHIDPLPIVQVPESLVCVAR